MTISNDVVLRFCQTPITWLRSLSVILQLFWRHDIANIPTFAAKTWEVLLWRHEIHDVFPRNWATALQNLQFFHHFMMKLIFSLLTWLRTLIFFNSVYQYAKQTFNEWFLVRFEWSDVFAVVNYMVQKFSFCSNFYVDVLATFTFYTFLSIWKQPLFHETWSWSKNLLIR